MGIAAFARNGAAVRALAEHLRDRMGDNGHGRAMKTTSRSRIAAWMEHMKQWACRPRLVVASEALPVTSELADRVWDTRRSSASVAMPLAISTVES